MKKIVSLAAAATLGMTVLALPTIEVSAATTNSYEKATGREENPVSKSNITPVASKDGKSLRQIAKENNISLSVLERLNDNLNPDETIENGTPLYLPFNVRDDSDYDSGVVNNNTDINFLSPGDIFTRSGFGRNPVGNPYANVPAKIKTKYYDNLSSANRAAKVWIAYNESTYSYTVWNYNHTCYGRFQLNTGYLKGDYSKTNQEKTADRYVKNRYGSWSKAKAFWVQNGWY